MVCAEGQVSRRPWVWRWWLSCVVVGGALLLGGSVVRSVALFSVFQPGTVELEGHYLPAERLQSYRVAVNSSPYVWAGGVVFFVGVAGSVAYRWRQLRQHGWLVMAAVLAALALAAEVWLVARFDIPLVMLFAGGAPSLEVVEPLVLKRVRQGGSIGLLAAYAEWTVLLLFIWRPLEQSDGTGAVGEGVAGSSSPMRDSGAA
ncbi:MAG: hypothetical protein NZ960_06135 [Candidatus Kapabacteria bacterium]|nr:hypothetical protein [Candidatus Kapabacteria bacterium]MDW8012554.1 hypothetical protein [Bacteroidota bacterium]